MNDDVKSTIEDYTYWDIFEEGVQQRSSREVLGDINTLMNSVENEVTTRASEAGQDVTQTRRTVAGTYFQALVSYATADIASDNGFRLIHNPRNLNGTELAGAVPTFEDGSGEETELTPDTDIVYFDPDNDNSSIFIVSCKTSFRERMTQSALWQIMFTMSNHSCPEQNCPTHQFSLSGDFNRDIYMGFATTDFYDSIDSIDVIDLFDFGYVPSEGSSTADNVYPISCLVDHIQNEWGDIR